MSGRVSDACCAGVRRCTTQDEELYHDERALKKQREANRLLRIRANQTRMQASSAEALAESTKAEQRRLRTVLRQQLMYHEALASRLGRERARNAAMMAANAPLQAEDEDDGVGHAKRSPLHRDRRPSAPG